MKLRKILEALSINYEGDLDIKYISYDSRDIKKDTLFICKGKGFNEKYLIDAIERGVVAYISEVSYREIEERYKVKGFIVEDIREAMPIIANTFYNHPSDYLNIISITGTKGKSTTSFYMKSVLDEWQGCETGIISSIETYNGAERFESHITTPEAMELIRHLRTMVDNDIKYLTLEVSSQALKYQRVAGMNFDIGIFTNISEDHISPNEHRDFNDYFNSKLKIFEQSKYAVINLDSDHSEIILERAKNKITYSLKREDATFFTTNLRKEGHDVHFSVKSNTPYDGDYILTMPGFFNVENALAVICASSILKIPREIVREGLRKAKSQGRMEIFSSRDKNIIAIVDYAHNKLSFEKLFSSMKEEYPGYSITAIFGTTGGKAFNRRKEMGEVAGIYCDKVYLTADDPGPEEVVKICEDIAIYLSSPYEIIEDREEAIRKAFNDAKGKSLILVIGKGEETAQKVKGELVPYPSDLKIVKEIMENLS